MPCVFVYGVPPDIHATAAFKTIQWPETGDEYEILGGFRGEPIDVVESETIPGLLVPADAEWIIEGEMLPEDYVTPAFGEDLAVGIMIGDAHWPVFRVKCITHRRDPWWVDATFSSNGSLNGHEGTHIGLAMLSAETDALYYLRSIGFKVKDVVMLGGFGLTVVQTSIDAERKPVEDYGTKIMTSLRGSLRMQVGLGGTAVVGPDINPYDANDVLWAMFMRGNWLQQIDALVKTPAFAQYIVQMTPKPGFTKTGAMVRCEPTSWETKAVETMGRKLGKEFKGKLRTKVPAQR
jgi:UbiD family decarboxylase